MWPSRHYYASMMEAEWGGGEEEGVRDFEKTKAERQ